MPEGLGQIPSALAPILTCAASLGSWNHGMVLGGKGSSRSPHSLPWAGHFPYPSSLQPGLRETTPRDLPDHTFQIYAREDYPKDQPHSQSTLQALGSTSSVPQLLLHPRSRESLNTQTREFHHSTNSSRRKPGPYSTSKYLFQDQWLQRQKAERSWRGNAAGWAVSMEQRDESVPSAGCSHPAAPKSIGFGLG